MEGVTISHMYELDNLTLSYIIAKSVLLPVEGILETFDVVGRCKSGLTRGEMGPIIITISSW